MKQHQLRYRQSIINYYIFGTGKKILFCFHGYSRDGTSFYFLQCLLAKDYTFICIDLPFHGKTVWKDGLIFMPHDLLKIISQINPSINQPFSLLGFSMGGRIALELLQLIPQKIERVVLIAPDGLHKNFWYHLTTQTIIGNKIFSYTMRNPKWFLSLMNAVNKFKLVDENILSIAHYYSDIESERLLLYNRWTTMRKFKPQLKKLKSIIQKNKISVRLLFGKYDPIILSRRSDFLKSDSQNIQIHIIDAGHRLLQEKYADIIAQLFYQ